MDERRYINITSLREKEMDERRYINITSLRDKEMDERRYININLAFVLYVCLLFSG